MLDQAVLDTVSGIAPEELDDWYESLEDILHRYGPEKLRELLVHLQERAYAHGVMLPFTANTPYINTIHHGDQVKFPGNRELERRIKDADCAVVMKVGRHLDKVRRVIERLGLLADARYIERATMAEERILALADVPGDSAPYFSTILVRRPEETRS